MLCSGYTAHVEIFSVGGHVNRSQIIDLIDGEISRLEEAKELLSNGETTAVSRRGRPAKVKNLSSQVPANTRKRVRTLSPETRAKIAAAQRARWASTKKAKK